MELLEAVRDLIRKDKRQSISFYEYMHLALYHPQWGYYSKAKQKVGKEGDFYTNSSVGSVFGETLADPFAEMMGAVRSKKVYLIEFGGGTGDLMRQVLDAWRHAYPDLLKQASVVMIEKSPYHKALQQDKLSGHQVEWFDDWPSFLEKADAASGVVFSNELVDAFPVYLAERSGGVWKEVRIGWNSEMEALEERLEEWDQPEVEAYLAAEEPYLPGSDGYRLEVNLDAGKWMEAIAAGLHEGYVVTIDYGFLRDELYLPQRRKGTLMCYRNHIASEDPLVEVGNQDITAHVNFSYLMDVGERCGLHNLGYFKQSEFLINGGILKKLQEHQEADPFAGMASKRNRAIRQLILPGGMGETFKVLVQAAGRAKHDLECLKAKGWM